MTTGGDSQYAAGFQIYKKIHMCREKTGYLCEWDCSAAKPFADYEQINSSKPRQNPNRNCVSLFYLGFTLFQLTDKNLTVLQKQEDRMGKQQSGELPGLLSLWRQDGEEAASRAADWYHIIWQRLKSKWIFAPILAAAVPYTSVCCLE